MHVFTYAKLYCWTYVEKRRKWRSVTSELVVNDNFQLKLFLTCLTVKHRYGVPGATPLVRRPVCQNFFFAQWTILLYPLI